MTVYEKISNLINQNNITEYRLGKDCSIDTKQFYQWKNNKAKPSIDTLIKISDYFCVSTDYLLGKQIPEYQELFESLSAKKKKETLDFMKEVKACDYQELLEQPPISLTASRIPQKIINIWHSLSESEEKVLINIIESYAKTTSSYQIDKQSHDSPNTNS